MKNFKNPWIKKLGLSLLLFLFLTPSVFADDEDESQVHLAPVLVPVSVIVADQSLEVGKSMIFDASKSLNLLKNDSLKYEWDLGDGRKVKTKEVVHTYEKAGMYQVSLKVSNSKGSNISTQSVLVYNRLIVFITDNVQEKDKILALKSQSEKQGVFVKLIEDFDATTEFLSEEILVQKMIQNKDFLLNSSEIVMYMRGGSGLKILSRFSQVKELNFSFKDKDVFFITDEYLRTVANIARTTFRAVNPNRIILTGPEALWPLIESVETAKFLEKIKERGIDVVIIDDQASIFGVLNFMSSVISYMIEKGIPSNTIGLVLLLPVIVTVIAFMKQVIGLSTMGVYTPAILTLSFLAINLHFGLLVFLIILISGSLTRVIIKRFRLLYIPRMAVLLTVVSMTILAILWAGSYFNLTNLVAVAIFPMLIMSTLVEKFISIQSEKGFKAALYVVGETLLVSIVAFLVVGGELHLGFTRIKFEFIKTLMLGYPELIFLFLLINIFLGRFTGLRLAEYIRFREVFRRGSEEE